MVHFNRFVMRVILLSIGFIFCCSYFAASQGLVVIYEEAMNLPNSPSQFDNPQIRAIVDSKRAEKKKPRKKRNYQ
jgi:hypothetical protein